VVTSWATAGRASALFIALGVVAPTALAQVTFSAPADCGSEQEFLAEVRALQRADSESIRVTSVIIQERGAGGYELRLDGPEGGRVLTDPDCRTLFRSAVVIAAAAGGEPAAEPAAPEAPLPPPVAEVNPAPPTAAPAAAAPVPAAPVAPTTALPAEVPIPDSDRPTAPEPSEYYWRLAVGGGATTGLSPDIALVLELGAAFGSEVWGGSLVLKYLPQSSSTTDGDLGLDLETVGGRSGILYAPVSFLRLEAGLAVYRLTARGTGISHPTTDSVWLAAPELEVMFRAQLSRAWALEIGPQGRVGLTQPTFQVEPEKEVFQVPRFGAALIFRVQWGWR